MDMSIGLILKFLVVVSLVPLFSLPAIVSAHGRIERVCELISISQAIGVLGGILGELYMHGQLSVKREMSNAKSPLFSHFAAAVNGIVSIRAYGAEEKLRAEARRRADKYTRAATAVSDDLVTIKETFR
jgi:ABC-type multidrug transport system fused ATPase/permease subunit